VALVFEVLAYIGGGAYYQPGVETGVIPCWPSDPYWGLLELGDRLRDERWNPESFWDTRRARRKTLRVAEDFDLVVLGVGIGAVPHVCREIVASNPDWRAMVDHVKTVATQAFQVWLRPDLKELGWSDEARTISGFVEPFDTWADMSHLLAREGWEEPPGALAYFCNALPDLERPGERTDSEYPARQHFAVFQNALRFLKRDVAHLWPRAADGKGGFRWDLLVDFRGSRGADPEADEARLERQFWTANVNPSDRYALSLPGSAAYRISPLDCGYDNLTIAGDWTACGFNAGCVEAAVMSGLLAAHAISLSPDLDEIIGYDHP
jgi:uncharacterized protein with NAD-binding domain and iron-sulfur cluster